MNKMKILLAVLMVALLLTACRKEPVVDPTTADPTTATSEQLQATEENTPVENLPGVEENDFSAEDIQIPTDPVISNTGSGNQGSSGNEGSTGNQGSSGNEGSTGNQGTSGNEGSTGNQGSTGNEGSSGNEGSTGNEGSVTPDDPDNFYVTYEEYNAMTPEEQVEYFNKFESMEAFVQWYNDAKDAYDAEHGAIEIGGDGSVDLGEIINP